MSFYKNLPNDLFKKKIDCLYNILQSCIICGHRCGINRREGEKGKCRETKLKISSYFLHHGEESVISGFYGSGTIFFSACNLSCVFCQNYQISQLDEGIYIDVKDLCQIMLELQAKKAHNINLVSPTHFLPYIIEAIYLASNRGLEIPIVYNTGGFDSPKVIKILNGIVDIYLPDMKYAQNETGLRYSLCSNYADINREIIKLMYEQVGPLKTKNGIAISGLLVRHLVMPSLIEESKMIIDFLHSISNKISINIMDQYRPCFKAKLYKEINRILSPIEFSELIEYGKRKLMVID